jgi:Domain of unknown function (DUF1707)
VTTSNDHRYDSAGGPRDRSFRVGDKERDAVSEILRRAHVEGRLDDQEFDARLERCLTAKTYADLDGLIADFPREGEDAGPTRGRPSWRPWPVPFLFLPLAVIVAVAVGGHVAWLAIPLVFFFVVRPLAWHAWGGGSARGTWACGPRRTTPRL